MKIDPVREPVLAGDIGATKTHLGLFRRGGRRPRATVIETFASREFPDLAAMVRAFLERHPAPVAVACFGLAGPVSGGRSKTTNLPWEVSEEGIRRRFQWHEAYLINDLVATAYAIPLLRAGERFPLNRARASKEGNLGLIAPGTGLGMALLVRSGGGYLPVPSEGGHADFAPNNPEEVDLWRYLRRRYGHVSAERLLSGPGIHEIYCWLKATGRYREPARLARRIKELDPSRVITEAALKQGQPLCRKTLGLFVSILGAVAGNLALTGLTFGGLYLGGGIPPKILPALQEGRFMASFSDKGRFKGLLEKIPVKVVLNEKAALMGAAHCALTRTWRTPSR